VFIRANGLFYFQGNERDEHYRPVTDVQVEGHDMHLIVLRKGGYNA
jgi:hypothetical protein